MAFRLEPLRATWGPREVAAYLGISRRELARLVARGSFPPALALTSGGRRRLWIASDVVGWLEQRRSA